MEFNEEKNAVCTVFSMNCDDAEYQESVIAGVIEWCSMNATGMWEYDWDEVRAKRVVDFGEGAEVYATTHTFELRVTRDTDAGALRNALPSLIAEAAC